MSSFQPSQPVSQVPLTGSDSTLGKTPVIDSTRLVEAAKALEFFRVVGNLKNLKRTGWIHNGNIGIPMPESVADHMYRMSMLSFMVTDASINKDKLIKICLVHDLAESIVGDITPHCGVSKEEKKRLEEEALKRIINGIGNQEIAKEILELWMEYEEESSVEGVVAHQLDKFEMILQADEYERTHPGKRLQSFFESTKESFQHPEVTQWANLLRSERDNRIQSEPPTSNTPEQTK